MTMYARSFFSQEPESMDAGRLAGEALITQFDGELPKIVLVYATTNHDQEPLLAGLQSAVGADTLIVGCSVQGVVGNAELTEEGLAMAAMAFGGTEIKCAAAIERDIERDSRKKGQALASSLKQQLGEEPGVAVVLYDPLCGADIEALLAGIRMELSCPVIGGGAGQPWGPPTETFQYWGREVLSHGVVAIGLAGPFAAEIGICHGTSPTGLGMTITKSEGSHILEIDGQPALDVWRKTVGYADDSPAHQDYLTSWAIGIQHQIPGDSTSGGQEQVATVIRSAFGVDPAKGSGVVQAAIPQGTRVMFHHRTVEHVLGGTEVMGKELAKRLVGRSPWAVLGFECAARTFPFLGAINTLKEHALLRKTVAPDAAWLGMMAWGEIGPSGGQTAFHNYTYPLVVLTEKAA